MSDYKKEKVVRLKVDEEYLENYLGIEDVYDIDVEDRYKDIFDYSKVGKFQIAPTEDFFIDFVIESEYGLDCGGYGKTRHLRESELEKYKKIFSTIVPEDFINDSNIRVVEYCWYNATECYSYFDDEYDNFYDEV